MKTAQKYCCILLHYHEKLCRHVWAEDTAPGVLSRRLNQPNFEILFNQNSSNSTTQSPPMYCKQAPACLLNNHQLGVRLGPNLIIHCFDFIWNKTKHNDAAFWQVLVCLRQKLHHPACSNDQSSLLELYCILKCSTMAPFTGVLSEKYKKYKRKWLTCTLSRLFSYYNQTCNYLQLPSRGEISFLRT